MTLAEFRRVYPTAAFTVSSGKLFTYRYYACGKSIRNICLHCGERKKPLRGRCFHALILQLYPDGGFEYIKAAVPYAQRVTTLFQW